MRKCFLIISIFIFNVEATKPKSVNLALETVLEFNNKDNAADVKFLDEVQQFIYKVKSAIDTDKTSRRFDSDSKHIKFTDFIKNTIDILKTYDDDDLEDTFAVFDDEIRKYHYRGCKFYELVEDHNVRRFVANKLNDVKDKPASHIRKYLDKVAQAIEDAKFSTSQTLFLDYINSLYRHDSDEKLKSFLNNLQTYSKKTKRANLDLIKVMKDGIRSVIFDHYSSLNANARRDLKIRLETNWKDMRWPGGVDHRVFTVEYTNINYNRGKKIKFIDLDEHTNRKLKARTHSTKRDTSLEESKEKELTTPEYKKKHKHRYRKVIKDEDTTKKYRHHKKISSFVTLYPEEIEINTNKRFKIESTKENRMFTLWDEKIKHKKRKPKDKNFNNNIPKHIISNHDTVIDVKRTMSEENDTYIKHSSKHYKRDRHETKSKKHREQRSKTTKNKPEPTTMKFRKHLPLTSPLVSEEGMSIESYAVKRRSMYPHETEKNTTAQTDLKRNVLRRINNLEKQMEEVKSKIDTKLTTTTDFERLEFWDGTTSSTKNDTTATTTTKTTKNNSKLSTQNVKSTISSKLNTFKHSTTKTKSKSTVSKKQETGEEKLNTTDNTPGNKEEITTTSVVFEKLTNKTTPEEIDKHILASPFETGSNNDIVDMDADLDKIMKKYNMAYKTESTTSFDFDKLLGNAKPEDKKVELNEIIENDMKKVMETKPKSVDDAEYTDPLQDINAALDLI